ncbi:MAG: cellobiose phosphorylase [Lachnospiraceae bacterium]|jgi:cellobiose phosphorylase|nr:cellobiose phosphorylase [Lachnospiraceae bacterium]
MKLTHISDSIQFRCRDTVYSFLPTGDIELFTHGRTMINGYIGNKRDGSANNIWLRIHRKNKIDSYPLLGISSDTHVSKGAYGLKFSGTADHISYEILFRPSDSLWFWDISLEGHGETVDIIYGQDLGMADQAAVLENELYAAQYLGHTVLEDSRGFHICSRQNLPQDDAFPFLQQGMLHGKSMGYSTDGLQFFGLSYKARNVPASLSKGLESNVLQSESSYIALQSCAVVLTEKKSFTFYCLFLSDHPRKVSSLESMEKILSAHHALPTEQEYEPLPRVKMRPLFGTPFSSPLWGKTMVDRIFPEKKLEEYAHGRLLSFFLPDDSHVVLAQKELFTERPHGNIITTQADMERINHNLITSTHYIYGIFNSQTAIGNTTKHKLLSTARGQYNLFKNSGQRIWVSIDGQFRILGLPSAFVTGLSYSKWLYQIGKDILQITSWSASDQPEIVTEVKSLQGISYDFIVTHQLVMGVHEFSTPITLEEDNGILHIYPDAPSSPYPDWHYDISVPGTAYTWSDERIFFEDSLPQSGTMLCLSLHNQSCFQVVLQGFLEDEASMATLPRDFQQEEQRRQTYYDRVLCGFFLEKDETQEKELEKLNTISKWYAHNALIHFSAPHGLEQPGGAAWGTRDICQGPFEFFLTTQKYQLARNILLQIYSHQFSATGEWPQWFMFDKYSDCQTDCHGDVVFWPLKCIGDYLVCTGDNSIWEEKIPYKDTMPSAAVSLTKHIKLAVSSIEKRFLPNTFLVSYAGGDWDDTLQPAEASMKDNLVSSWTQALAFQVLQLLHTAMSGYDNEYSAHLGKLAHKIKESFEQYFIIDGTIAGFILRSPDGSFSPLLHPGDTETGIHLRLLPLTRSVIAGLADQQLAEHNMDLIEKYLHFPDGVRLMDSPAKYDGGVSHLFRRAEQAANVGREISLQYVHAHIRYIEALCRTGKKQQAWSALFEINPIGIKDHVPNAALRQSNLYFSSSDGSFRDRYEYAREFHRLRDGSISVKGGWRIYSSGPGIYISRLIGDILGIRFARNALIIDPALPAPMDGLRFHYQCFGHHRIFIYHLAEDGSCRPVRAIQNGRELPAVLLDNPYRSTGISIDKDTLDPLAAEIHIYA